MPEPTRSLPETLGPIDKISIGDLIIFRKVCEIRSFQEAGKQIGLARGEEAVTANGIKSRIDRMEGLLEGSLFERGPKGVELTALAHQIMPNVRNIIANAAELYTKVDERQVVIGLNRTIACRRHEVLLHLLDSFKSKGLGFHIRMGSNEELLAGLLNYEIDVAIVAESVLTPMSNDAGFAPLSDACRFMEPSVALVSESRFDDHHFFPALSFLEHPIISFEVKDMPGLQEELKGYLGPRFLPRHHVGDWETMFSLVMGGHGVALVPKGFENHRLNGVKILPIQIRTDFPHLQIPSWKYAIVRNGNNGRALILEVEKRIAEIARQSFQTARLKKKAR